MEDLGPVKFVSSASGVRVGDVVIVKTKLRQIRQPR